MHEASFPWLFQSSALLFVSDGSCFAASFNPHSKVFVSDSASAPVSLLLLLPLPVEIFLGKGLQIYFVGVHMFLCLFYVELLLDGVCLICVDVLTTCCTIYKEAFNKVTMRLGLLYLLLLV